jgi:hypothetical protein
MDIEKVIAEQTKLFETQLNKAIEKLNTLVLKWQQMLFERLNEDLILSFSTEGGAILQTAANLGIAANLRDIFNTFFKDQIYRDSKAIVTSILELADTTAAYYESIGFDKAETDNLFQEALAFLREKLGIDESGKVLKDGALYEVLKSETVVQSLKNTAIQAVVNGVSLKSYSKELRAIATGENGEMFKYYKGISFDYFNQSSEIVNSRIADGLGLEWFIYQGSIKDTTRAFCSKRASRVFSVKEAQEWKNDRDLTAVKDRNTYNPMLQRGGYNCRHFIKYISKEMAETLEPSKFNP